jgi:amino acid adenylation domain-containing protein
MNLVSAPSASSAPVRRRRIPRDTIVDVLRRRAADTPTRSAYTFLSDSGVVAEEVTFAALDERARAIGGWLQTRIPREARVLLLYPPGLQYISAFFGCLYAGAIAVPAYPPRRSRTRRGQARLDTVIKDADVALVLTCDATLPTVEAFVEAGPTQSMACHATTGLSTAFAHDWQPPAIGREGIAFLQYTSGSTSDAKGVIIRHGNIMANERMIQAACGHTAESTFVGWLPVYHDMGLLGNVLQPLYCGAACVLMSPTAFLQRPARWLQAMSQYRGRTSGAPNFAYALCTRKITDEECVGLDLSSWTIAFNGAEPVHAETLDAFADRFAPYGFRRESFYPCYGLAEATLIVSGGPREAAPRVRRFKPRALENGRVEAADDHEPGGRSFVSCGPAVRETTIEIVEPQTRRRCAEGQVGEIWVSGPAIARGYWNRPQQSEEQLRARLAGSRTRRRFLRTGDLGFLDDGTLFVTGRLRDLIIIRGENHHAEDLEWTVLQCGLDLAPGAVAAFAIERAHEEQLVIVAEVNRRDNPSVDAIARAIRGAIAEQHQVQVHDVGLVETGTLPKTSSGKIQRYLCRQAYLDGELPLIGHVALERSDDAPEVRLTSAMLMATDGTARPALVARYLQQVIERLLGTGTVPQDLPLVVAGIDSLIAVEAAHRVQMDLDVPLAMASLLDGATIADLAAWICAPGRTQAGTATGRPTGTPASSHDGRPHDREAAYPLSRGQQALWFMHRMDPDSPAHIVSRAFEVRALDVAALKAALARVRDLHPQLTMTLFHDGTDWMQRHDRAGSLSCVEVDASDWSEATLDERLNRAALQPFDLERGPVMRVTIYRRSPEQHIVLLSLHHLAADLWSFGIILQQIGTLYGQPGDAAIAAPAAAYADFVDWQARMLAGEEGERLWAFWKDELSGDLTPLDIAAERSRPREAAHHGARHRFRMTAELTARLRHLGQTRGATLYAVLMAVFQIVLHRYTGRDDFLVGTPAAGRSRAQFADVVGTFINVVPIRARIRQDLTFVELVDRARETTVRALAHQDYPFSSLVERLQPVRDPTRAPLCQVLFALQRTASEHGETLAALALEHEAPATVARLRLQPRALREPAVPFELILTMAEVAEGAVATLDFNVDLFDAATIARMAQQFTALLACVADRPQTRLTDCATVTPSERAQILGPWNATDRLWDVALPVQLFERQAAQTPEAIAVAAGHEQHSYRGLDEAASRLAARLRARGAGPETVIALAVTRSPRIVIGLLAVMKAGAAFLPIDPDYPPQRIAFALRDAGVRLALTDRGVPPLSLDGLTCLDIDIDDETRTQTMPVSASEEPLVSALAHRDQLAYVIYTSGSTGTPKGVQITNSNLVNFLACMPDRIGLDHRDVMLASTSLSFDVAALELLAPLTVGARVCIAGREETTRAAQLADTCARWQITMMQATPTSWQRWMADSWREHAPRTMLCGGEALGPELAVRLRQTGAAAHNLYGPTETTIWSASHRLTDGARADAIGRPIANTRLFVVDAEQNLAPIGVAGELCIGGAGVARGYIGRADLTAERFVPDAFSDRPGARLYKTGDRAFVDEEGVVHFIGRRDRQIKLRGVRIELGEIEAALRAQRGVTDAVVILRHDETGEAQLAAYVIADHAVVPAPAPTTDALYAGLSTALPSSMLPQSITFLDRFSTTPNGKLDRQALPEPRRSIRAASRAPQTPLEEVLAWEWARVLDCDRVGIDDNFFALGGHSLLATQLVWQIQDAFPTSTSMLALLLRHPTVAELAIAIAQHTPSGVDLPGRVGALQRVQAMSDDEVEASLLDASAMAHDAEHRVMETS